MSEDTQDQAAVTEPTDFDKLQALVDVIKVDGPKGLTGNKQAARRARSALNDVKKLCTPLRISIQEAIKTKKA